MFDNVDLLFQMKDRCHYRDHFS